MRKEKMMNLDLGSDGDVQYISWKAQEQTWDVDGEKCELKQFLIAPDSIKIGQGKLEKGQSPIWKWNDTPGSKVKIDKDSYKIKILGCSTIKDLPCEFTQKEV